MVPLGLPGLRAEEDEEEPGRDGDLRQVTQGYRRLETNESDDRTRQEIHLADQDVGGLCALRNLPHETVPCLCGK